MILGDLNDIDGGVPDAADQRPVMRLLEMLKEQDPATDEDDLLSVAKRVPREQRRTNWWDRNGSGKVDAGDLLSKIDQVPLDAVVHSDGWGGHDGPVDPGHAKRLRVHPDADQFADAATPGNHINGIESFWGYAETRLARCRGTHPHTFLFHLQECEVRFSHRGEHLYGVLLDLCRRRPLS